MRLLMVNWGYDDDAVTERAMLGSGASIALRRWTPGKVQPLDAADCASCDAIINYSAVEQIGPAPDAFPRCRIVVRSGVGFDNVDLKGWGKRGVPVSNVPDYGTTEVADHAIALMMALTRGTATYQQILRPDPAKGWRFGAAPLVKRLRGAAFGVIGLGRIGLAAALRAQAFNMRVVFFDPYLPTGTELSAGFTRVKTLEELMAASDVVSVHAPLSDETRGLVGAKAFAAAKPGAVIVNTARGPIVDLDALEAAIRSGKVGGAGLDVLPAEPADANHPLIAAWIKGEPWIEGRLVLSPHAAFYSPSSIEDLRRKSVEVVVEYVTSGRLLNCVNQQFLEKRT
jgi:D-3-phosphoglycerate dehydrogenase/C-terminal binding protein